MAIRGREWWTVFFRLGMIGQMWPMVRDRLEAIVQDDPMLAEFWSLLDGIMEDVRD